MSEIFISYASEDRPRAKIIAEALEHQGYSVWWDVVIPPGKTFDEVIKEELDSTKCIIVLWSWKSILSDWVKEESSEGVKRKILIPVLIDDVEIPLGFKRIQAARLIDWSGTLPNPEFDILLKSVKELMGQKQSLKVQKITKKDNQMKIFGTIRNSKNQDPVKDASITLSIEGTQIAAITSDELGGYKYTAEEDYTGQTLDFSIQKEGFIGKDISHEIDRFEIESDILIDEIEIKIEGKICDETDSPLDNASISFSIGGSTIDLTSDKDGSFSFTIGQQFLNQSIGYEVNKEGFKITSGKLKLLEYLKCINISKTIPPPVPDKSMWIKVAAVGTILTVAVVVLFALLLLQDDPELLINPDPIDFDFVPESGAQNFSIRNEGNGTLEWDVSSDQDWIIVSTDSGTNSGTVSVSVNSAGMDPGRHTGRITVKSNGGIETGGVSLYIREVEPTPTLGVPRIDYFRANPEHMDLEGQTTLSWEISGATSVTIDGVGPVEVSMGSIQTWVYETTNFTIRATNDAGISDDEVTVTIEEQPPRLSLNPDPPDLNFGIMDKGETDYRTFWISNIGGGTLEGEIIANQWWIDINPTTWTNSEEITVTVKTEDLHAGSYDGTIIIYSNVENIDIPVSFVIEPSIPAAPSKLTRISSYPCEIEWIDNSENEDGFNIYIGGSCANCQDTDDWTKVARVGKDVLGYSWSESCCDVAECSCVMVRAYSEIGESPNSNIIMLATIC